MIRTPRLLLRPWAPDDLEQYLDIYSRIEVMRYLGNAPRVLASRAEAVESLARRAAPDPDGPPHGVWAVCPLGDDRPIGTVFLKPMPWSADVVPVPDARDVEVGWHLHPDAWGHGYATEAARGVLAHAWEGGLAEVRAVTHPDNTASAAVCRRLGMASTGRTTRYYGVEFDSFALAAP